LTAGRQPGSALLLAAALMSSGAAHAGNQKEEAMADSVRLALERHPRHRPPKPAFRDEARACATSSGSTRCRRA
jgi:hypothetical protein